MRFLKCNFKMGLRCNDIFVKSTFSGLRQILATEALLKMIKNAFYFTSKALSFSRYLNFCLDFLVTQQNGLIRKISLISNFMTSQPGQQTIEIRILSNIWRSKGNLTMKFGQLIECSMRNIFLEKSYTKRGGKTSPRPSSGFELTL